MKNFTLLVLVMISLASCEKLNPFDRKKENLCPVVATEQMPPVVTHAFAAKYSGTTVNVWFNKDNKGFCATFKLNGNETKALFDNNGNFVKEEIETDDYDQKGCNRDNDDGCECELKDE